LKRATEASWAWQVSSLTVSPDPKVGSTFETDKDHNSKLEKGLQVVFVVSK
jgi:hypothetical protein